MSEKKRSDKKSEKLTREELRELMGENIPTYKKVKGRVRQND